MYRAVVLTTLVLLLLAVAGVSVAQDGRLFAGGPNSDDPPESTQATTLEQTSFEATDAEDTTTSPSPGASSETEDHQNILESTVATGPTAGEHEKSTAAPAGEDAPTLGTNDIGEPDDSGRGIGKPEHAVRASDPAAGSAGIGQHGNNGESVESGNQEEPGRGLGRQKASLCHKGNKPLTVGAPALAAHLRHGDTRGACQGEVSGPEPSGGKVGPEAARNGEGGGGGQDKAVLCHKNKTITVGASAQAAHLRHGDSLGACP
ncbi:MAG TPA: hypothetical protein VJ827_05385 [Rubrobacter sp.]|nr:hypothetical protein [Rubrobacter sp.]